MSSLRASQVETESEQGRSDWKALLIWLGMVALLLFREFDLLRNPRFFAEEGTHYFRLAYQQGFVEGLLQRPKLYISIFANVLTGCATLVPLERAPLVTTFGSALVQLAVLSFLYWGRLPFLRTQLQKVLGCLAVLFVGSSSDIWFNSISLHPHVALIVLFILLDDRPVLSRRRLRLYCLALFVCGLEGITGCFLWPLFLLRYWKSRSRSDFWLFSWLAAAALVQLILIVNPQVLDLSSRLDWSEFRLANLAHFVLVFPILDEPIGTWLWWFIAGATSFTLFVAARQRALRLHLLAYLVLAVGPFLFSLHMTGGARYAHPGAVCLVLLLLRLPVQPNTRRLHGVPAQLLLVLAVSVATLQAVGAAMSDSSRAGWTTWKEQVALWKANPRHWMIVDPQRSGPGLKAWRFRLTKDDITQAAHNQTEPAQWTDDGLLLPVVHIPMKGNRTVELIREVGTPNNWRMTKMSAAPDERYPMAALSSDFRRLQFLDVDGKVRFFIVVDIAPRDHYSLTGPIDALR